MVAGVGLVDCAVTCPAVELLLCEIFVANQVRYVSRVTNMCFHVALLVLRKADVVSYGFAQVA